MSVVDQRMASLDRANAVRIERAGLRMRIAAGEISAVRVLEDATPACAAGVDVLTFLTWMPRIGRRNALMMLRKSGVPGHRRLEDLTGRQLEALLPIMRDAELHPRGGTRAR